jgi:hypothetical protein
MRGMAQKGTIKEVSEAELRRQLDQNDNRRTDPRVPARLEVEVPLASVEQFRRVYTTNISKGGLMFTMVAPATMPAELAVVLALPGGQTVKLEGEVRHVKRRDGAAEFEVGVQFRVGPDSQKIIDEVLSKLGKA